MTEVWSIITAQNQCLHVVVSSSLASCLGRRLIHVSGSLDSSPLKSDSASKWLCEVWGVIPPFCLFSFLVFNKILQGGLDHPWVWDWAHSLLYSSSGIWRYFRPQETPKNSSLTMSLQIHRIWYVCTSSTYWNKLKICSCERRRILNALVTQGNQSKQKYFCFYC